MTKSIVYSEVATKVVARDGSVNKKIGREHVQIDTRAVTTVSIDETDDRIMFCAIPSNAIITDVLVLCDDLDSHSTPALAVDIGLYYSGIGGDQAANLKAAGDIIDVDAFASAYAGLQAAIVSPTSVRFEAANITTLGKEAWDLGGLSADCGGLFFIGTSVTTAAATAAAGDLSLIVKFIV